MVLLLRAGGVPARVVTGFLGGAWNRYGEYLVIRQGDAHAWVEVWFPTLGWVTFDPTPPAGLEPLPSDTWFARMQMLLDSLRMRWQRWVIDYDVHEQASLLDALRRGLGRLRDRLRALQGSDLFWPALASGLLLAFLALLARRRRRRDAPGPREAAPRGAPLRLGRMVARWLQERGRLGLSRAPGETVHELAARLDGALPGLEPSAESVVLSYYRLRYGGDRPTRAELDALELELKALLDSAQPRRQELTPFPGGAPTQPRPATPDSPSGQPGPCGP
jgi:hypothetical protein